MSSQFIIVAVILLVVFIAILIFASSTQKAKESEWISKIRTELNRISSQPTSPHKLVELDKLMDYYLKNSKVKGETMGERLKKSKNMFSKEDYNKIWNAHKLRNEVVHEVGYKKDQRLLEENIRNLTSIISKLS